MENACFGLGIVVLVKKGIFSLKTSRSLKPEPPTAAGGLIAEIMPPVVPDNDELSVKKMPATFQPRNKKEKAGNVEW